MNEEQLQGLTKEQLIPIILELQEKNKMKVLEGVTIILRDGEKYSIKGYTKLNMEEGISINVHEAWRILKGEEEVSTDGMSWD